MSFPKQLNQNLYKNLIKEGIKKANKQAFTESEMAFLKAIKLNKKNHLAHINLSNVYILQNKIKQAVELLMDYILKYSFNETISNHTAKVLYLYNYKKDLLNLFKASDLNSKYNFSKKYYLYFIKGSYYENEKQYKKTEEAYLRSIESNKYYFDTYNKLLNLYEQTNEFDKFNKLLKHGFKNFTEHKYLKILLLYKTLITSREKNFLISQEIIVKNDLYYKLKNDKIYLSKLLDIETKNNEKLKNYNLAFQKAKERNNILLEFKENKKFDGKNIYNSIDKYKIFFKKNNVESINTNLQYQNDENLVFLIGFPRSGTTLMDSILRSHSKISVLEEKPYLLNLRHEFFIKNNNNLTALLNITQNIKDKIRKDYFEKIHLNTNNRKKIIIDKFPLTIIELGFIKCIFPNAKIILAMRHPCDVVLSCYFSTFKINDAMINFLSWDNTINFYNKVFDLYEFYEKELNLQSLTVKYEDIVENFNIKVSEITNFLGLDYEDNMENFYLTARKRQKISTPSYSQVINPLYSSSINRWKNFSSSDQAKKQLNKWIKKFNY
tara:strand:+ start:5197 stop:6849 length:1653 start_codon:yes stop_codon:yes gene_type:complete